MERFAESKNTLEESSYVRPRYTNTNFNIINQKGVFVFNYHPCMPIQPGTPRNLKPTPDLPYINCIDIHKSIKERVLGKIGEKGVREDYLFADFNKFSNDVAFKALRNFQNKLSTRQRLLF